MDWTRWMFQEETLHTSVLAHLLDRTTGLDRSPIATALLGYESPGVEVQVAVVGGLAQDAQVDSRVEAVVRESRVASRPGRTKQRTADLSCGLSVDGVHRRLIVETKVDSAASRQQLDDMSWGNDHTILLALGSSALARSQDDLDAEADAGFISFEDGHLPSDGEGQALAQVHRRGSKPRSWTVVTPEKWVRVLEVARSQDPRGFEGLDGYLQRMHVEAELHRRAREGAAEGQVLSEIALDGFERFEERLELLTTTAWAGLIREHLRGSFKPGPRRWNLEAARDVRGTKLVAFVPGWDGEGLDVYFEAGAQVDELRNGLTARFVIKASGPEAFRQAVARVVGTAPSAVRAAARTSTLKSVVTSRAVPEDVASWLSVMRSALDEHIVRIRAEHGASSNTLESGSDVVRQVPDEDGSQLGAERYRMPVRDLGLRPEIDVDQIRNAIE